MATFTISLSEAQAAYVSAQVRNRGLKSADEYLSQLILTEQLKSRCAAIDASLLEGLDAPYSDLTEQDLRDIEREGLEKLAEGTRANGRKTPKKQQRSKRPA